MKLSRNSIKQVRKAAKRALKKKRGKALRRAKIAELRLKAMTPGVTIKKQPPNAEVEIRGGGGTYAES